MGLSTLEQFQMETFVYSTYEYLYILLTNICTDLHI